MDLLKYIWRKRKFIAIVAVLVTLIYYGVNCFYIYYSEIGTISFIYPDSENGRYPDGTRFNIYDLMSEEVLLGTVNIYNEKTGKIPIKLSDIENAIVIDEITPYGIQTKVQNARNLGQDYSYFANEYRVTVSPIQGVYKRSFKNLFGIIPDIDNKFLIESLYKSYTRYFMDSHAEMNIIPKITQNISYDGYDYVEIADVFETRINMYITYLESKLRENGSYSSKNTGKSFNDLIAEFKNLNEIKVKNLRSFVSSSKLAKNPEEFINKLRVQNESYNLYYNKLADEAEAARTAMNEYDHSYVENIVITGQNEEVGLYQARPKTAYDTITKRALDVGVSAQAVLKDIEENNRLINEYANTVMSPESQTRLSNVADRLVLEIEQESERLVALADETIADYLDSRCSDYVRFTYAGKSYFSMNLLLKMAIILLLAIFGAILYLYLFDKDKKPGVQEITEILGIKISKRKIIVDMLIKLENKLIIQREKRVRKSAYKNANAEDLKSGTQSESVPNSKGYIERFFEERENKRKLKLKKMLEKEEEKRAKKKKNKKQVELIFDTSGKEENVHNNEAGSDNDYSILDVNNEKSSNIDSGSIQNEFSVLSDVQPEEITELLYSKALPYDSADLKSDTEELIAENEIKPETVDYSDRSDIENLEESHSYEDDDEMYDGYEEDDIYDDIYNSLYDDYYPIDYIDNEEEDAKADDTVEDKAVDLNVSDKIVRDAGIYDISYTEMDAAKEPKFIEFTDNGVLGGMRHKIDEILSSEDSVIDELLKGNKTDDLFGGIDQENSENR